MRSCWSKKAGITSSTPAKRRERNQLGKGRGQSRPFSCSKGRGAASQATKSSPNFWGPREGKKRIPPGNAEKAESGAFWAREGMGDGLGLCFGCCSPAGSVQRRAKGQLRPARAGKQEKGGAARFPPKNTKRVALPGSRHKTQNRRRRFGPGESSEGRRDAAWLAGETAGYPAKVPFRRPLVWRFCQKGKNRS